MRESTFEDYLILRDRGVEPRPHEPFMGLDPDGFFGESSLTAPVCFGSEKLYVCENG
jgi:hypothetical protein